MLQDEAQTATDPQTDLQPEPETTATAAGPLDPVPTDDAPTDSQAAADAEDQDNQLSPEEQAVNKILSQGLINRREAVEMSQRDLVLASGVSADSIRDYELGKYRPSKPTLKAMAKALDVMPLSIGPSATRGLPPTTSEVLRNKRDRPSRVQFLVGLLADHRVSVFARLVGLTVGEVYDLGCSDAQLTVSQLEPISRALPQVRGLWLMEGEGEPLNPALSPPPAPVVASTPVAAPPLEQAPGPQNPPAPYAVASPATPPPPVYADLLAASRQHVAPPQRSFVAAAHGSPQFVPLGEGVVAMLLTTSAGAITGLELLASVGAAQEIRTPSQLAYLMAAMQALLAVATVSSPPAPASAVDTPDADVL